MTTPKVEDVECKIKVKCRDCGKEFFWTSMYGDLCNSCSRDFFTKETKK